MKNKLHGASEKYQCHKILRQTQKLLPTKEIWQLNVRCDACFSVVKRHGDHWKNLNI